MDIVHAFAMGCWAGNCWCCGVRLAVGDGSPWCRACAIAVETAPPTATYTPNGLPVYALWLYGGAVADALGTAKSSGTPLRVAALARPWRDLLQGAVLPEVADGQAVGSVSLCAVAPERQRLAQRGWHLPDQLAGLGALPVARPLQRTDHAAPRRHDRATDPQFTARRGRGNLVLIDDVVTTGRTLDAAAQALAGSGWQVVAAAVLADARALLQEAVLRSAQTATARR